MERRCGRRWGVYVGHSASPPAAMRCVLNGGRFFVTREATLRAFRISRSHWGQALPERCPKSSRYYMALTEITRGYDRVMGGLKEVLQALEAL